MAVNIRPLVGHYPSCGYSVVLQPMDSIETFNKMLVLSLLSVDSQPIGRLTGGGSTDAKRNGQRDDIVEVRYPEQSGTGSLFNGALCNLRGLDRFRGARESTV